MAGMPSSWRLADRYFSLEIFIKKLEFRSWCLVSPAMTIKACMGQDARAGCMIRPGVKPEVMLAQAGPKLSGLGVTLRAGQPCAGWQPCRSGANGLPVWTGCSSPGLVGGSSWTDCPPFRFWVMPCHVGGRGSRASTAGHKTPWALFA